MELRCRILELVSDFVSPILKSQGDPTQPWHLEQSRGDTRQVKPVPTKEPARAACGQHSTASKIQVADEVMGLQSLREANPSPTVLARVRPHLPRPWSALSREAGGSRTPAW